MLGRPVVKVGEDLGELVVDAVDARVGRLRLGSLKQQQLSIHLLKALLELEPLRAELLERHLGGGRHVGEQREHSGNLRRVGLDRLDCEVEQRRLFIRRLEFRELEQRRGLEPGRVALGGARIQRVADAEHDLHEGLQLRRVAHERAHLLELVDLLKEDRVHVSFDL